MILWQKEDCREMINKERNYKERNRVALMEFLTIIGLKYFEENAAKDYGIIKKELKDGNCLIGPLDMLIGAHTKSLGMTLVTNNVEEFQRITNLKIENWI